MTEDRLPSETYIRSLLVDRIDHQRRGHSIVVGILGARGRRVVAHSIEGYAGRPLNGDTIFEIGSITKTFTSLLLAQMIGAGEVRADEPVADLLPAGTRVPSFKDRPITLVDLATHTSSLPCLPDNFAPADDDDPYADYTSDDLHAFLATCVLEREIGSHFEYSNLGIGLLGYALAHRGGTDFATLLRHRVLAPLGLTSTGVDLGPAWMARLAQGRGGDGNPVPTWHTPTLAGCGGHLSSANDLLTFVEAELGFRRTALTAAMELQLTTRRATHVEDPPQTALGLFVSAHASSECLWHDGGTGGYCAFVGFDRQRKFGVVVMSNVAMPFGIRDLGLHLLCGSPLERLPPS